MADTIRNRATLLSLLADNATGDISPQDMRDVLVSVHGVWGGIRATDTSTAQGSIGTSFVKVTGFAANVTGEGITADHTNDRITIDEDGTYFGVVQIAFSGTANATFIFNVHVDQNPSSWQTERKLGGTGDVGSCSFFFQETLTDSEQIEVYVKADAASKSITVEQAQFLVYRVA